MTFCSGVTLVLHRDQDAPGSNLPSTNKAYTHLLAIFLALLKKKETLREKLSDQQYNFSIYPRRIDHLGNTYWIVPVSNFSFPS